VDASESSIESRDAAIHALADLGNPKTKLEGLVVYIPTNKPLTDEQKQADPFSIYTECGGVFPEDDGDEFVNLCLKAKPDFATEIRRIFAENPFPSFGVIDAIGHGSQWPQLRATLKVDSARDILLSLMAPTDAQIQAVKSQEGWASEARELLRSTLSMSVKTRAKSLSALSEELWRFVLFSEFVFDLPEPLPESLNGVPRAADDARPLILDLCDELRARERRICISRKRKRSKASFDFQSSANPFKTSGKKIRFLLRNRHFFDRQFTVLFPTIATRLASCSAVRSFPFGGTEATVRSDGPS
jgi:hypothetical protein